MEKPKDKMFVEVMGALGNVFDLQIGFLTRDMEWVRSTERSDCHFCSIILDQEDGLKTCKELDMKARLMGISYKDQCIFKCNFGLLEIVIPIYGKTRGYLGSLFVGQFLDHQPDEEHWQNMQKRLPYKLDREAAKNAYMSLPYLSPKKIYEIQLISSLLTEPLSNMLEQSDCNIYRFDKIVSYINNNYQRHIALEDLAALVHTNPSYISQIFKKELGITFSEYLRNIRIKKAKELLLNDKINISEIASAVGFPDQNYFCKIFRQVVGSSPRTFRQNWRGRN